MTLPARSRAALALACVLILVSVAPAAAPRVGEAVAAVTLQNTAGEEVVVGGPGDARTVLVVLRGFPGYQCPLCSRQVAELRKGAARFADAGARVVLVYPGPAEALGARASEFAAAVPGGPDLPAPLELVVDPAFKLVSALGVRWVAPGETAYPATLVLSAEGKVEWLKVSDNHGGRSSADEVLAALAPLTK